MLCIYTEEMAQDDKLLLNKTMPHFQLLPMPRLTSPNKAFMRYRLYSNQKVI